MKIFKIGIIGSLKPTFDIDDAKEKIKESLDLIISYHKNKTYKIVSVMTNEGIPKLAYDIGNEYAFSTIGYASNAIYRGKYGVYPVDEVNIVGKQYGDECEDLIKNIDCLIRIGGGYQSNYEVELFKKKIIDNYNSEDINLNHYIIEKEIKWNY